MGAVLKIDVGQRFCRLTVSGKGPSRGGNRFWLLLCECGNSHMATASSLIHGRVKSCGCLNQECRLARNTKHGMAPRGRRPPEYWVWQAMLRRCDSPTGKSWRWYGARGVRVCDRWRESFEAFLADMGARPQGTTGKRPTYSIDRIDVNGNYEPGNCRWATTVEQANNRRRKAAA